MEHQQCCNSSRFSHVRVELEHFKPEDTKQDLGEIRNVFRNKKKILYCMHLG